MTIRTLTPLIAALALAGTLAACKDEKKAETPPATQSASQPDAAKSDAAKPEAAKPEGEKTEAPKE